MKKGIVITGPASSGKTILAKGLDFGIPESEIMIIDGRNYDHNKPFWGHESDKNVKLVIFDSLGTEKSLGPFFDIITNGLKIDVRRKAPFIIKPRITLVFDEEIVAECLKLFGDAFHSRFDVIEIGKPFKIEF